MYGNVKQNKLNIWWWSPIVYMNIYIYIYIICINEMFITPFTWIRAIAYDVSLIEQKAFPRERTFVTWYLVHGLHVIIYIKHTALSSNTFGRALIPDITFGPMCTKYILYICIFDHTSVLLIHLKVELKVSSSIWGHSPPSVIALIRFNLSNSEHLACFLCFIPDWVWESLPNIPRFTLSELKRQCNSSSPYVNLGEGVTVICWYHWSKISHKLYCAVSLTLWKYVYLLILHTFEI